MNRVGDVAHVDARSVFGVTSLPGGAHAARCLSCGGQIQLDNGMADARVMKHAPTCEIGLLLTGATKPLLLHFSGLVKAS